MPRKPIEWSKCIIYKIWKDDDFYVGSTTDFTNRKRQHKNNSNNEKCNFKIYQTIRENGGWIAWKMTPLEEYKECQSQIEARIREEEWRVKLNANLNIYKAYCSKEEKKEYMIQYHQEHKDEEKEYSKKYRQEHKEEEQKYRQECKEELKIYLAQYYQNHKEKLNAKFECECGGKYIHQGKSRHEKTKKHQTYLATI